MSNLKLVVKPYSFSKSLFEAYGDVFELVMKADWVCFLDGDVAFLEMSDFGDVLEGYIERFPDTGIFTSYASRCHYEWQRGIESDSVRELGGISRGYFQRNGFEVVEIDKRIAGHLVMMKKEVWLMVRGAVERQVRLGGKKILGFDTQLSRAVLRAGYKIRLMKGVYVFHYLRAFDGKNDKIL